MTSAHYAARRGSETRSSSNPPAFLEAFLQAAADRADGAGLPPFIAHELREFLTCGVLANGFARVRCTSCAFERLAP
jgi:hypothetical protein